MLYYFLVMFFIITRLLLQRSAILVVSAEKSSNNRQRALLSTLTRYVKSRVGEEGKNGYYLMSDVSLRQVETTTQVVSPVVGSKRRFSSLRRCSITQEQLQTSLGLHNGLFHRKYPSNSRFHQYYNSKRNFHFNFFLRGGGNASSKSSDQDPAITATTDISMKRKYVNILLNNYPISVCSVQGWRDYMEDEFFTANDFIAVFDGHGGKAISRYLRQNLYANLQAALPMVLESKPIIEHEVINNSIHCSNSSSHDDDEAVIAPPPVAPSTVTKDNNIEALIQPKNNNNAQPTVLDYETALELALDKVDREVQRISHWSFQGSTAVAVWIHTEEEQETAVANTVTNNEKDDNANTSDNNNNNNNSQNDSNKNADNKNKTKPQRTLITANIGDSRAVISRNGTAIELTRDHKPNDPIESKRIHRLGGRVIWHGQVDSHGVPIPGTGIYRVNGNLALSRAIGDRSERPAVTADPEFSVLEITDDDEFIVLATDGLWDVMSSSDTVAFIHALIENSTSNDTDDEYFKESIATSLVEEALRRGSYDNITVIVVWMNYNKKDRPKKYWI